MRGVAAPKFPNDTQSSAKYKKGEELSALAENGKPLLEDCTIKPISRESRKNGEICKNVFGMFHNFKYESLVTP